MSPAERKSMTAQLKVWAKAVNGKALNYTCKNASVPKRLRQPRARIGYGTSDADSWHVCYDDWKPWETGCLGVSVGIGGEWGFEDGLVEQVGCTLYAFDPTDELRPAHEKHAQGISMVALANLGLAIRKPPLHWAIFFFAEKDVVVHLARN